MKAITAKDFVLLAGSKPPAILDRPSWLEAVARRYDCSSYRFGDVYVGDLGSVAVFATRADVTATMDGRDWSGHVWVTDLWRKSSVRRRWKMAQRIISRVDDDPQLPRMFRALQLWK